MVKWMIQKYVTLLYINKRKKRKSMLKIILFSFLILTTLFSSTIQLDNYFDKNGAIMLLINPKNGKIVKANQAASNFYGHSIKQLERMKIQDINTFTKEQVVAEMQRAKTENRNYFIFRHRLDSGEIKRVEVYSHPITYKNQKVLFSTIHDVTNLDLAQKTIEHYSQNLEKQVDIKSQELIQTEKTFRYILIFGLLLQLLIIIILLVSIKKQKKAEEHLEQTLAQLTASEKEMSEIIESFPISIIRAQKDGQHIDFFNQSFHNLFGWSLKDVDTIDKWFLNAYPEENYRKEVIKDWEKIIEETHRLKLNTAIRPMLVHVTCKNGEVKECQAWYHRNEGNIFGIFYDMTKQKELEKENLNQQKMLLTQSKIAAVGEMLGNIAHQWRQPLSHITAKISGLRLLLAMEKEVSVEMLEKDFDDVMQQSEYLSQTIEDFKNFFSANNDKIETFNIKDTLNKLHGLIKDSLHSNYIKYHYDFDDIEIKQNENRLIQATINICNNAKDAMIINDIDTQDRHFFISLKKIDNKAIISFKDSAGGITEDIQDKIFEPYFTTKHRSQGTGIGLYMTYQIITTNFNGEVTVKNCDYEYESQQYTGAEFKLILPLTQEKK